MSHARSGDAGPRDAGAEAAGACLRIMVVDDHALFRYAVSEALSDETDMQVVAQASSGEEALELVRQLLGSQDLDLVLMDIDMPGIGGVEATRRILAENPELPVVMLTGSALDHDLFAALEAGAIGFLTKNLVPQAIVRALRDYNRQGALPMPRTLATKALTHLQRTARTGRQEAVPPPMEAERLQVLSAREQQVLELIAQGATDRQIGQRLVLSENTVKKHVKAILARLGARNRAEAAARLRLGRR